MRALAEKPHRRLVDFSAEPQDFKVVMLGCLGFTTKCIARETGLTECQVMYRLRMAKVDRRAYRNGETDLAKTVIRRSREFSEQKVLAHIRLNLA